MRNIILVQVAKGLIVEENCPPTKYAAMLSGNAKIRGQHTAKLYHEKQFETILCPGQNLSFVSAVMDTDILEPEFSKKVLNHLNVPDSAIELLVCGTSTKEEADTILQYCLSHNIKEITIISSEFHTKRIRYTYKELFDKNDISVYIEGAKNPAYDASNWWKSESGLINCNNEWIKLLYYLYKY